MKKADVRPCYIVQCVRIVAPIPKNSKDLIGRFRKSITNPSPVTYHLSPDHHSMQLQLLWFGDLAAGSLVIDKVEIITFLCN